MRPAVRDLAIVLGASWLARAVFIAAIGDAQSSDVGHWVGALAVLDEGGTRTRRASSTGRRSG